VVYLHFFIVSRYPSMF